MGLCKCPKKKVTTQFCFEHRVNVCEHCMMTNHPKCIVQSYLQWLQDSDYNPICELCRNSLATEDCVRLICYHVFHWHCLDHYARQLPPNTAPAGYTCPTCQEGIFPKNNLVSPVVDTLNVKLSEVNWARVGLGLPLVDEIPPVSSRSAPDGSNEENRSTHHESVGLGQVGNIKQKSVADGHRRDATPPRKSPFSEWKSPESTAASCTHSVVDITSPAQFQAMSVPYTSSVTTGLFSPKRMYDARDSDHAGNASFDHDENKYKRRSAVEWFGRWFKSASKPSNRRDPSHKTRRFIMIAVLVIIGLLTLIIIMMRLGRASADADPFLDPMANPNIRVINEGVNQ